MVGTGELRLPTFRGPDGRTSAVRGAEGSVAGFPVPSLDGVPHVVLGFLSGVDRSTISRTVGEVRSLPAACGFAVPGRSGGRLRTLADAFAYAAAEGVVLRLDATEVQVRRPACGRGCRRAFASGKKK